MDYQYKNSYTAEELAPFKFKLKKGNIIFNERDFPSTPGCPQFKRGYYKIIGFRDGLTSRYLKPRDRVHYLLLRCSKNGKEFKQDFAMCCSMFDSHFDKDEKFHCYIFNSCN